VRMDVDEARRDGQTAGIEPHRGGGIRQQAHCGDGIPFDSDISVESRATGAIDHLAAGDQDIELGESRKAAQQ
jgi:hypothetical protein